MLVRKASREHPDQKQSDLGLDCLSGQLVFKIVGNLTYNFSYKAEMHAD